MAEEAVLRVAIGGAWRGADGMGSLVVLDEHRHARIGLTGLGVRHRDKAR